MRILKQERNMILPALPGYWNTLALLEMKLDWPWREAGKENK